MSDGRAVGLAAQEPAAAARVLIAEDEKHLALLLEHFLVGRGHSVHVVHDGSAALAAIGDGAFDVALLDVQMPVLDGLAVLRETRAMPMPPQVVVMTGNGTIDTALAAMQAGAYDYVAKPYRMAEVDLLVRRAAERRRLECEGVARASALGDETIVTAWAPLRAIVDDVARAAPSLGAMLVSGEPGTGRATLARHAHGVAGGGSFVELDGAAAASHDAPDVAQRVAAAAGGTLYVRTVDALPADAQRLVAEALDAPAPARLVLSTARSPEAAALDAALRGRLAAVVELPPLRERAGDVRLLAGVFVRRFGGESPPELAADAVDALERHAWPGNVAELRLVIEGAVARATSDVVAPSHLGLP